MSPFSNLEVFESHLGNLPFDIHHVLKVLCSFNSSFVLVITYMSCHSNIQFPSFGKF